MQPSTQDVRLSPLRLHSGDCFPLTSFRVPQDKLGEAGYFYAGGVLLVEKTTEEVLFVKCASKQFSRPCHEVQGRLKRDNFLRLLEKLSQIEHSFTHRQPCRGFELPCEQSNPPSKTVFDMQVDKNGNMFLRMRSFLLLDGMFEPLDKCFRFYHQDWLRLNQMKHGILAVLKPVPNNVETDLI